MNDAQVLNRVALDAVLEDIEVQCSVVERRLESPAQWRGPIRRELRGREAPEDRQRYASAFNSLVGSPRNISLDVGLVLRLHDQVVGGDTFRDKGVRIGWDASIPPPVDVPRLVAEACQRAVEERDSPLLNADSLHLAICRIHPFVDGNGRVARLLGSLILLQAGYRSTLLTAVEQHFHADPGAYGQSFATLQENGSEEQWLLTALTAMQTSSAIAAWILRRSDRLRQRCAGLGLSAPDLDRALADFDLGRAAAPAVAVQLDSRERPLLRMIAEMDPEAARELVYQVQRVREEAVAAT